jgi:hypothetical protein
MKREEVAGLHKICRRISLGQALRSVLELSLNISWRGLIFLNAREAGVRFSGTIELNTV